MTASLNNNVYFCWQIATQGGGDRGGSVHELVVAWAGKCTSFVHNKNERFW